MATTKKENEQVQEQYDPWEKVKIKLPRSKNSGRGLYVNVNDYNMWIPRGQVVEIPRCVAEVIENSVAQDEATWDKIEQMTEKANY